MDDGAPLIHMMEEEIWQPIQAMVKNAYIHIRKATNSDYRNHALLTALA